MPTETSVVDTRARLTSAARQVISEVGLGQARMEDIASRAGVSRAAVYYHFHTKSDLATAIIDQVLARLTDTIEAALAEGPIDGVIDCALRFFAEHAPIARLLIAEQPQSLDPVRIIARHREALHAVLRRRISTDIAAGRVRPMDPDIAAQALASLMRVVPLEMLCNESADLEHLTEQLTDFVRHALAPSP